jgi:isocitrate/isopropylmalate dehydrogenase
LCKIAVPPGGGTGPEVGDEALDVPESAAGDLRGFDGILLGTIGHPDVKPGIRCRARAFSASRRRRA